MSDDKRTRRKRTSAREEAEKVVEQIHNTDADANTENTNQQ